MKGYGKIYFDEIDSKIISRMSVQGKSIEVKGLYKEISIS